MDDATATAGRAPLLAVDGLEVSFATARGWVRVVEGVAFQVAPGEVVGLVGESGSGKTVSSLAVMRLLPPRVARVGGTISFAGRYLTDPAEVDDRAMRRLRGREIAMIFQEPMTSLNPAFTVGNQIAETVRVHRGASRREAWGRAVEMLERVGIPAAARRAHDYPHTFSGGMRQRAMIAMALACEPRLLIADEPTTALDVTVQAQILELLRSLQRELTTAIVFVTHDLGVVADIADRVVVMYAGQVVEDSSAVELFDRPAHPYTEALLASMPQLGQAGEPLRAIPGQVPSAGAYPRGCRFAPRCRHAVEACAAAVPVPVAGIGGDERRRLTRCARQPGLTLAGADSAGAVSAGPALREDRLAAVPLLEVSGLATAFPVRSTVLRRVIGRVRAVDGVDFAIGRGATLGLVGESGSGKSTTARLILCLDQPTAGSVRLDGRELTGLPPPELRAVRRQMQIVFQDPYSSLDPRMTIAEAVGEPLEVYEGVGRAERDRRVIELLDQVGLGADGLRRYPHEFSGGQRQRIAIARALALRPGLLVCDEPVSSLDVSTRSQVINLLTDLQAQLGLTYLFISHDLSVVRHVSERIAVMYLGRIVEQGAGEEVYHRPRHPYTEALLSAILLPDPRAQRSRPRIVLAGDVPSPLAPPTGCRFHPRCRYRLELCREVDPPPFTAPGGTVVHCHLHTEGPRLAGEPVHALAPSGSSTASGRD